MNTPWGKSDSKITLRRGISFVTTPGHGGFMVSKAYANKHFSKSAVVRGEEYGGYLAYEEDCNYAIVVWEFGGFDIPSQWPTNETELPGLGKFTREQLIKSLSRWHADYLQERGVVPDPEGLAIFNAHRKEDAMRAQQHPDLIISASGDWADWVPNGRVGVITADHKRYTVPEEQYSASKTPNLLSTHTDVQPVSETDVLASAIFGKKAQS